MTSINGLLLKLDVNAIIENTDRKVDISAFNERRQKVWLLEFLRLKKTFKDKESLNAWAREYKARYCEDFKALNRAYKAQHKEELSIKNQEYYAKNREKRLAYQKAYYARKKAEKQLANEGQPS